MIRFIKGMYGRNDLYMQLEALATLTSGLMYHNAYKAIIQFLDISSVHLCPCLLAVITVVKS